MSEETGQISTAMNGILVRDYTKEKLKKFLESEIFEEKTEIMLPGKMFFSSHSERRKKK